MTDVSLTIPGWICEDILSMIYLLKERIDRIPASFISEEFASAIGILDKTIQVLERALEEST